jgi:hypothetical protein
MTDRLRAVFVCRIAKPSRAANREHKPLPMLLLLDE